MDHTVVHFEIPADDPERAAKFYRELFGWEISRWGNPAGAGEGPEYWMVRTVPTDAKGQPTRPGVNGGNNLPFQPDHLGPPRTHRGLRGAAHLLQCCTHGEEPSTRFQLQADALTGATSVD